MSRYCSYPFLSGTTLRLEADWLFDEGEFDAELIKDRDLIFIQPGNAKAFFKGPHKNIQAEYLLGCHFCACDLPNPIRAHLNSPMLRLVFSKNAPFPNHPSLKGFPIGLTPWTYISKQYIDFFHHLHTTYPKKHLLYLNFCKNTHKKERSKAQDYFANCEYVTVKQNIPFCEYAQDLAQSKFVLSPRGSGLDCYRTWEAMQLGAIPIVKHSCLDSLFKDLPVLLIHDWEEITEDFLRTKWEAMKTKRYKREKLFADYWIREIYKAKNRPFPPELRQKNPYLTKLRLEPITQFEPAIQTPPPLALKQFFQKHPCSCVIELGAKTAHRSLQIASFLPFSTGRIYSCSQWNDATFNKFLSFVTHCWRARQICPINDESEKAMTFLNLKPDLLFFNAEQDNKRFVANFRQWIKIMQHSGFLMGDGRQNSYIENFANQNGLKINYLGAFWYIDLGSKP